MIDTDLWYVVYLEGCRPHFCSNYYLAQVVGQNLIKRYGAGLAAKSCRISQLGAGNISIPNSPTPYRHFFLDMGTQSHRPPVKRLSLTENIIVSWLGHEEDWLKMSVIQNFAQYNKFYNGQFYKVHAQSNVLCLTLEQGRSLHDCLVKGVVRSNYVEEW